MAALNHALRDIPPERVRLHVCWGNYEGPHHRDVPLRDVLDIVLGRPARRRSPSRAPTRGTGTSGRCSGRSTLPDDKVIMPGVIDSTTHYVEHPELVAQRIEHYADAVGPERVIAGDATAAWPPSPPRDDGAGPAHRAGPSCAASSRAPTW